MSEADLLDLGFDVADYVGRIESCHDVIAPGLIHRLLALLDEPFAPAQPFPQGLQWTLCQSPALQSGLGADGHALKGMFLPPVPLPRRMWAATATEVMGQFNLGDAVTRTSRIESITPKQGASGQLVFVEVTHGYTSNEQPVLRERQTIVYRDAVATNKTAMAQLADADAFPIHKTLTPDSTLLLRYSGVTFNAHRIHYDRPYATAEEGYPDLVVHGPLIATLLLQLIGQHLPRNRMLVRYAFRAMSPAFVNQPLNLGMRLERDNIVSSAWNDAGEILAGLSASSRHAD
ncbi:MAG: FAS1-like dehydratase domain-containing protein [Sphingorhabdus sp.]